MVNQLRLWLISAIAGTCIILQSGCSKDNKGKQVPLAGTLIFTDGSNTGSVCKFDLQTRKLDTLFQNTGKDLFGRIVQVSKDEFVVEDWENLVKLDLATHTLSTLRKGEDQTYVAEHSKLFFYNQISYDKERGSSYGLYMVSMDSLERPILLADAPGHSRVVVPPVQISNDEIVFIGEDGNIWDYNIVLKRMTTTDISGNYEPIAWMSRKGMLLCSFPDTGIGLYEIDLATKEKKRLAVINDILDTGFRYIEKYDVVIYSNINYGLFGELSGSWHDLYVYSFKEKVNEELASHLRMCSSVYVDK